MNSTELFNVLYKNVSVSEIKFGEFETLILIILLKQSNLQKVNESLSNLKPFLSLEQIINLEHKNLVNLINPSGSADKKAFTIINLCKNINDEFGDFEFFKSSVSKEWLLSNKGISIVSVDEIMSFVCCYEEMAVSSQALKLANLLNYEFQSYFEAKEWFENVEFNKVDYKFKNINDFFCLYQILIYEFSRLYKKGSNFDSKGVSILKY